MKLKLLDKYKHHFKRDLDKIVKSIQKRKKNLEYKQKQTNLSVFHINNVNTLKERKKRYVAFEHSIFGTKLPARCIIIVENFVREVIFLSALGKNF